MTNFQELFERKFRSLFGEHFCFDGFQFPAGGHLDPLSGYRLVAAHLEPGWVHLRYTKGAPHREPVRVESPAQAGQ